MAYDNISDEDFLKNITSYKEFYQLHKTKDRPNCNDSESVIPKCVIDDAISKGNYMFPKSYQMFGKMFINPNTSYTRLLIKHNTGSGKTANALGIAMNFINIYRQETSIGYHDIGSIYIMGFENSKKAFERELYRYAEFGFISREEVRVMNMLIKKAAGQKKLDVDNLTEFKIKIRRRISNRTHNGFFKFVGYKSFSNRLFITTKNISGLQEDEIRALIKSGEVKINMPLLNTFKNSLMICDEVHNIYNSSYKNNWGVAIQTVLDMVPTVRAVFLSATPINNSPTEAVDLINLLVPVEQRICRTDFFDKNGNPLTGTVDKLAKLSVGRISYVIDVDPKYFPSKTFLGSSISGIPYLKFTRCPMNEFHQRTYDSEIKTGAVSIEGQYILDIAFPNPEDEKIGIYKSSDIKYIRTASVDWRNKHNIIVLNNSGTISGGFTHLSNIGKYSTKYHKLLIDVIDVIKNKKGKIFIYHPLVHVSGVLFIGEMLSQNGIIDNNSAIAANTLCTVCGAESQHHSKESHKFNAARFITVHSGVDNRSIERQMERYNTPRNAMGQDVMIVIGSRIMQESREVRNTENLMITHKPDNISALIQIIGRVVRTNSHSDLPLDRRNVNIHIYVSSMSDKSKLTYEEIKYKEKIKDYKTIQNIEKQFHEMAVDGAINHPIIKEALVSDGIGDLSFKPKHDFQEIPLSKLKLSTFTVYHTHEELSFIIYTIKRLFLERSQVWTYGTLWHAVQTNQYRLPVNSQTFSEENYAIALNQLTWGMKNNIFINDMKSNKRKFLDRLFDQFDRRIVLPGSLISGVGNTYGVIVQIGEYYMLFPMDGNTVKIGIDMPYRIFTRNKPRYINVRTYLERSLTPQNYFDHKLKFRQKYENKSIEKLSDAVCEFGLDFHIQFIEECVLYIFNIWTDPKKTQSEYHAFYFKMLYYYDIIGIIIWANTVSEKISKMYSKYILSCDTVNPGEPRLNKLVPKGRTLDKRNAMNTLAREIGNSGCSWCPVETKEMFESSLTASLNRFAKKIKESASSEKIIKIDPSMLPVGHLLKDIPHFYTPESGWFASSEYTTQKVWKENDIIIGFGDRTKTGVHVRFKLRQPVQKMKNVTDVRQQYRGTICSSINKTTLFKIAKQINIDVKKIGVHKLCAEIKARLMFLDLEERRKDTNIRYYYHFFDKQPDY